MVIIVLLLLVVKLLLCLIFKFYHRYVCTGKNNIEGLVLAVVSGIYWGSWNTSPCGQGGTTVITDFEQNIIKGISHSLKPRF